MKAVHWRRAFPSLKTERTVKKQLTFLAESTQFSMACNKPEENYLKKK